MPGLTFEDKSATENMEELRLKISDLKLKIDSGVSGIPFSLLRIASFSFSHFHFSLVPLVTCHSSRITV